MDGAATKHMEEIATTTTAVSLLSPNDMTPETVMSELNMFRTVSSALPHWEVPSSPAYSQPLPTMASQDQPGPSRPTNLAQAVIAVSEQSEKMGLSFDPMTPPASDATPQSMQSGTSGQASHSNSESSSDGENDPPARKKRTPIPDDKKDTKYWDRRKKNNIAAKRSRELRKKKMDEEIKTAKDAIQENQKLKQEIEVLKSEINSLRRLLRDANMTLSLWIRAKQSSEPASQLPPMLRNPGVSFVNFPSSSV